MEQKIINFKQQEEARRVAEEVCRLLESTGGSWRPSLYPEDQALLARAYLSLLSEHEEKFKAERKRAIDAETQVIHLKREIMYLKRR